MVDANRRYLSSSLDLNRAYCLKGQGDEHERVRCESRVLEPHVEIQHRVLGSFALLFRFVFLCAAFSVVACVVVCRWALGVCRSVLLAGGVVSPRQRSSIVVVASPGFPTKPSRWLLHPLPAPWPNGGRSSFLLVVLCSAPCLPWSKTSSNLCSRTLVPRYVGCASSGVVGLRCIGILIVCILWHFVFLLRVRSKSV